MYNKYRFTCGNVITSHNRESLEISTFVLSVYIGLHEKVVLGNDDDRHELLIFFYVSWQTHAIGRILLLFSSQFTHFEGITCIHMSKMKSIKCESLKLIGNFTTNHSISSLLIIIIHTAHKVNPLYIGWCTHPGKCRILAIKSMHSSSLTNNAASFVFTAPLLN